jgi:hypothetical protein
MNPATRIVIAVASASLFAYATLLAIGVPVFPFGGM